MASIPVFGAKRAFLVFLLYLGTQLVFGLAAGILLGIAYGVARSSGVEVNNTDLMRHGTLWGAATGMIASGFATYWMVRRMVKDSPEGLQPFGWIDAAIRQKLTALLIGVGLAALFIAAYTLFPPSSQNRPGLIVKAISGGGAPLYIWIAVAVLMAPPIEEFMFRGVMWTGLARSWGAVPAGIVTTLLFLAVHLPETGLYVPALTAIGSMGVAALWLRIRTGSLAPAVALHVGYNAVIITAVLASLV